MAKWLAGICAAVVLGAMITFPAMAGVEQIRLVFANSYETGTILEPQVYSRTGGIEVESVEWEKELEDWKPGRKVSAAVTLSSDEVFSSSYNAQSCLVSGGSFLNAKRDSDNLIVNVAYYPVVQLESPEEAGWSKLSEYTASWEKVKYATGYQLNLYCNEQFIRTIDTTTNEADLSEYMTKEGDYYYEVRATGKEARDLRYFRYSDYTISEDKELDDLGDTEGSWMNYTTGKKFKKEDGSFASNEWYKILGDWYYFDETSHMVTGWKLLGTTWYYMDTDGVMLTGWVNDGNARYYMNKDGSMATGWIQNTPGEWYYFYENGTMAVNTVIDGYAVNEKGIWVQN